MSTSTEPKDHIAEQLHWRYATKKFNETKKVEPELLEQLLEHIRLSATSYGLQPYRLVHIEDPEVRERLKVASYGQSQITGAAHLLLFAAVTNIDDAYVDKFIELTATTRSIPAESLAEYAASMKTALSYKDLSARTAWAARQAYIGMGTLLQSAAMLHVDACPMEGFNSEEYDAILGLHEKNLTALAVVTVGYRADDDDYQHYAKVRLPKEEFIITI